MIKLFEQYNQYYQEISEVEYDGKLFPYPEFPPDPRSRPENQDDFDDNEIKILKNLYDVEVQYSSHNNYIELRNPIYDNEYPKDLQIKMREHKIGIVYFLNKLTDEWYLVCDSFNGKYYKCDQFEGLLKCLDDILKFEIDIDELRDEINTFVNPFVS